MMKTSIWIAALMLLARIVAAQESCIPYVLEACDGDPTQYECVQVSSELSQQIGGESATILQEFCFRVDSPLLGEVHITVDKGTINLADLEEGDEVGQIRFDVNLSDFGAVCEVGDRALLVAPIRVSIEGDREVDLSVVIDQASQPLIECLLIYDPTDAAHNEGRLMEGYIAAGLAGGFELHLQLAELGPGAFDPGLEYSDLRGTASPAPLYFEPISRDGLFVLPVEGGNLGIETIIRAENELFEQVEAVFEESFEIEPGVVEQRFIRGDANVSGQMDLSDAVYILNYLYLGAAAPSCHKSADVDDNGSLELTDAIRALSHLFLGAAAPSAPYPGCGVDTEPDELTCEAFDHCP